MTEGEERREQLINRMFERGILLNEEMLTADINTILDTIEAEGDLLVLNNDYVDMIKQKSILVDWYELDKYRVGSERDRDDNLYQAQLQVFRKSTLQMGTEKREVSSLELELDEQQQGGFSLEAEYRSEEEGSFSLASSAVLPSSSVTPSMVTIVISYKNEPRKFTVADFTNFFLSRYRFLEGILRQRRELGSMLTISRVLEKRDRENVSIIGIVSEIGETKNGNLMITLEDITGRMKVLISKNNRELLVVARDLVLDEVIGITGVTGDKIIFAESIVWPDIPANHELRYGPEEEYVVFLSDIHVGSKLFLGDEFSKFLMWIKGEVGNAQQRDVAQKVKYIIIAGDLVDGVGIYPDHEEELAIKTIEGQYAEFVRLIRQIPVDKQIIICPGNHDVVHLAEPQPIFYQEFVPGLFDLPNVTLVTNPGMVNVGKKEGFDGFDILLYHGYSFDYYVANVESIRNGGGYHRSDLIMKFLLKRRHLAPSFTSTPYYPAHKEDPLLIKKVPDFLITGHIHYCSVANYKGITMISGSCWQGKTTFQEKLGHQPEPARVPVVNLKTRDVKILRF